MRKAKIVYFIIEQAGTRSFAHVMFVNEYPLNLPSTFSVDHMVLFYAIKL